MAAPEYDTPGTRATQVERFSERVLRELPELRSLGELVLVGTLSRRRTSLDVGISSTFRMNKHKTLIQYVQVCRGDLQDYFEVTSYETQTDRGFYTKTHHYEELMDMDTTPTESHGHTFGSATDAELGEIVGALPFMYNPLETPSTTPSLISRWLQRFTR